MSVKNLNFCYYSRILGRFSAYQFSTFVAVQALAKDLPMECLQEMKKGNRFLDTMEITER